MAIAYQGSISQFDWNSGQTPTSLSIAISTAGLSDVTAVMVLWTKSSGGSGVATPTIGGVSMTQVGSWYNNGAGVYISTWVLANAPIGASENVVATQSNNTGAFSFYFALAWYSGCSHTQPDASVAFTSNTSNTISQTITTTVANCWTIILGQQGATITGGTSTQREGTIGFISDSNGAVSTGSNTLTATMGSSVTNWFAMLSIAPLVAASSSNAMFAFF